MGKFERIHPKQIKAKQKKIQTALFKLIQGFRKSGASEIAAVEKFSSQNVSHYRNPAMNHRKSSMSVINQTLCDFFFFLGDKILLNKQIIVLIAINTHKSTYGCAGI